MPRIRHPRSSGAVNKGHPLNRGRVGWWLAVPNLMGGGKWANLMGRGPTGVADATLTATGNATNGWRSTTRPGGWGHVLFDGTAGNATGTIAFAQASDVTISAWIYPTTLAARYGWFWVDGGQTGCGEVGNSNGGTAVLAYDSGNFWVVSANNSIAANAWNHVCITAKADLVPANMHLYINGKNADSFVNGIAVTTGSARTTYWIGSRSGTSQFFPGAIDDVSIWVNRALSATDVWSLYDLSRRGYPGVLNRLGPGATTLYGAAAAGGGGAAAVFRRTLYRRAGSRGANR